MKYQISNIKITEYEVNIDLQIAEWVILTEYEVNIDLHSEKCGHHFDPDGIKSITLTTIDCTLHHHHPITIIITAIIIAIIITTMSKGAMLGVRGSLVLWPRWHLMPSALCSRPASGPKPTSFSWKGGIWLWQLQCMYQFLNYCNTVTELTAIS